MIEVGPSAAWPSKLAFRVTEPPNAASSIAISMTEFVDFATRSGRPKLTKVRMLKRRRDYRPASDFWKTLREGIIELHSRQRRVAELDELLNVVEPRKRKRYAASILGYQRFAGGKRLPFFKPPRAQWVSGRLTVTLNPELGVRIRGVPHVIKLYFRRDRLKARQAQILLHMMRDTLAPSSGEGTRFGLLDVERGRLHCCDGVDRGIGPLVCGEAAGLMAIWDRV